MTFKKVKDSKGDQIVIIKVLDQDRSILENWTIMMSDLYKWVSIMKSKYGINRKDKDLDWIYN